MTLRVTIVVAVVAFAAGSGCTSRLARKMVSAPNRQPDALSTLQVSERLGATMRTAREMDIPVGPPDARLHVWITEPAWAESAEMEFTLAPRAPADASGKAVYVLDAGFTRKPRLAPAGPVPTVFVLHGIHDRGDLGPYLFYKEYLISLGYRVVQVDLRGHGRSTGDFITYGVVEARDLVQVADALQAEGLLAGPVGAFGISYGASVAIQWAALDPRVKGIVGLEPFAEFTEAANDATALYLNRYLRAVVGRGTVGRILARAGAMAQFDPAQASPLAALARTQAPVLLIHSRDDEIIPFRHSERLRDAAPGRVTLEAVDKQSHFTMWIDSYDLIFDRTASFLARHVGGATVGQPKVTSAAER